jgi:hypothetical protein
MTELFVMLYAKCQPVGIGVAYHCSMSKNIYDWKAVHSYHDEGHGFVDCSRRFGFCHTAWIKAIQRGALRVAATRFADRRRRYDWAEVQAYYDQGHTHRETAVHFGFCSAAWYKAMQRGEIKTRPKGMPIAQLLASPKRCRSHLKVRLIRAKLLENRCEACGLGDWHGQPINMQLDHVNGVKDDNRLEICACCAQTATAKRRPTAVVTRSCDACKSRR